MVAEKKVKHHNIAMPCYGLILALQHGHMLGCWG